MQQNTQQLIGVSYFSTKSVFWSFPDLCKNIHMNYFIKKFIPGRKAGINFNQGTAFKGLLPSA